jgi:DAK2 domain fusion protein YloV
VDVTTLDGRAFGKFVAAGTYFLRKYRGVLNDLNVFPVPDGDTGSNMYLTARSALAEVVRRRGEPLSSVAAAAAEGSLLGARGNSGVIFSQMLCGFANKVRDLPEIDTLDLAIAMREAVGVARSSLHKPVEGTMLTVASAAADAAYSTAQRETDLYRLTRAFVRAAADALERTPDQLPILKEAGVVDSGGAGIVYFLEGILRFAPEAHLHATAFPQQASRKRTFTAAQIVSANKFCTEFILEGVAVDNDVLGELLQRHGDSLIVAGAAPTLKVHIHTSDPAAVKALVSEHGHVMREKVEDMELQHRLLVVDAPPKPFAVLAVVPGAGFAQIAREQGADVALVAAEANPSVRELVIGANACLARRVYLLANDPDVALAAKEAAALSEREVVVVPTRDMPGGLAVLLALATSGEDPPSTADLLDAAGSVRCATLFFAGKDSAVGGVAVRRGAPVAALGDRVLPGRSIAAVAVAAAAELGAAGGGLLTLYYGGMQQESDARAVAATLRAAYAGAEVEHYYGGQQSSEYVLSLER